MKLKNVLSRLLILSLAACFVLPTGNVAAVTPRAAAPAAPRKADLSRLVVVGDSLSAGFQNGSLIESAQVNGYAALVARQAGVPLPLPLIASPGIPNVLTLVSPGPPPVIAPAPGVSAGRVDPFLQPFDLAVPGHKVQDALTTRPDLPVNSLTDLVLGFPRTFILGQPPQSQVEQAETLAPTTVIVWLGNNDALGAALAGNTLALTPTASFEASYTELLNRLSATGATLVVANLPDVTVVPALTSAEDVAARVGLPLSVIGPVLGIGPGDYVTQGGLALIPGILANPATGPLPNGGVLTAAEAAAVSARVGEFNAVIAAQAAAHGAVLVDIHSLTETLSERGYVVGGQRLTNDFLGGIFSLDGVHPTNTGYAVIANEFIKALNTQGAAGIPPVNVRKVQKDDPLVLQDSGHPASALGAVHAESFASLQSVMVR
jgi:phospholipase/lecithinase/hemolysin